MVTEVRRLGNILALYTDDARVYEQFHKRKYTLREVTYFKGGKRVAVDLYFDRRFRRSLVRVIKGQLMLDL